MLTDFSLIQSFLIPLAIFEKKTHKFILKAISQGLKEHLKIEDERETIHLFNSHPENFLYHEDLESIGNIYRLMENQKNKARHLMVRFRTSPKDDYHWYFLEGFFTEGLLFVFLNNIDYQHHLLSETLDDAQEAKELLDSILANAQTPIFWKDMNRCFIGANQAFLNYFEFESLDYILGKKEEDLIWHKYPERNIEDEISILKSGRNTQERDQCLINNELRDIKTFKSPLYIHGQINGLVGSIVDITSEIHAQKKIEGLNNALVDSLDVKTKADKIKSDFMAQMSHDMRTPLTTIMGLSELSLKDDIDDSTRQTFQKIQSAGKYLLALINDLLEVEKFQSGKMELYNKRIAYDHLIQGILDIIEPNANQRHHIFKYISHNKEYKYVITDQHWVNQIIINLLNNSIKYTPKGGIITWEDYFFIENDQLYNQHVIKDNGIGISEEFQKQMYEPFTQERTRLSRSKTSTGLGLNIVKNAVEMFGGKIECQSHISQGTSFIITLPMTASNEAIKKTKSKNISTDILKGLHILIVEDVEINGAIIRSILSKYGATSDSALNGQEAVDFHIHNNYDVILMDLRMPVMDGFEAARKIREIDQEIPIIALSANAYEDDKKKALQAGMNDHIEKPINQKQLIQTIIQYIF